MAKDESAPPPFSQLVVWTLLGLATVAIPVGAIALGMLLPANRDLHRVLGGIFMLGIHASIVGLPVAGYLGYVHNRWALKYNHTEESVIIIGAGLNALVGLFGILVWTFHWD